MHIYVSGASGRNGKLTVEAALSRGHTVTALVRSPSSLEPHPGLTILKGTPLSQRDVEAALVTPCPPEAIITALAQRRTSSSPFAAPAPDSSPDLLAMAMQTLLAAIQSTAASSSPPKLIVNSSQGSSASIGSMALPMRLAMRTTSMRRGMDDHDAVEAMVRGSGLRFVIVKPCFLTEGSVTPVRVWPESGSGAPWVASITRASVAGWMVDAAEREDWDGTAPVITN